MAQKGQLITVRQQGGRDRSRDASLTDLRQEVKDIALLLAQRNDRCQDARSIATARLTLSTKTAPPPDNATAQCPFLSYA